MISPVIALFVSIRNFRFIEARWNLILFFGLFGMTMIILDGKDAKVHADFFQESYVNKDFKTFITETENIILLKSMENEGMTNDDLYLHIVSFLTSRISSRPAFFFLIVSLIYGIFYIRGVTIVYQQIKSNWSYTLAIIFFLFVFWKSLEGINSIRNWTAAWIFFNGAFSYFQTRSKKFILLVLLSPLVHFAYILIILPFLVVYFFGNKPKIYFLILLTSFFVSFTNIDLITDYLSVTELGAQKLGYIKEGSSSYMKEGGAEVFYAKYYLVAGNLAISILFYSALVFFGYLKKEGHNYLLMSLASMGILLISFSNIVTFSVVISKRIFTNGGLFALAYLIVLYSKKLNNPVNSRLYSFNLITYFCVPLILFFTFTQWSQIGDFIDAKLFVSPLTYWIFEGDYSLKELIRELIF